MALVCVALTGIAIIFIAKLVLALRVAPAGWVPGVAIGAVLSTALIALTVATNRVRALRRASTATPWVVAVVFLADFFYALRTPVASGRPRVLAAIDAGAYAFAVPVLTCLVLVIGWAGRASSRRRREASE